MTAARIACPAKINVFLAVGRPDPTGYHPIRSIFQAISLYDFLAIRPASVDSITFDVDGIPAENTVSVALRLLREAASFAPIEVRVEKQIPSEAGLGGGSSDAAGLLRWARENLGVDVEPIAPRIGADVPFFLTGGRAKVEGYGEVITPLDDLSPRPLVVVKPDVGCPTGPMYRRLDQIEYVWRKFPTGEESYNDFERVAPCECIDWIERLGVHGATSKGLSGSGSAIYGFYESREAAEAAATNLRNENAGRVFVCETVPRFT